MRRFKNDKTVEIPMEVGLLQELIGCAPDVQGTQLLFRTSKGFLAASYS